MIKAILDVSGMQIAVLGLTRENIDRLLDNQPIMLDLSQLGLAPQRIAILAGETEDDIIQDLRALGADRTPNS